MARPLSKTLTTTRVAYKTVEVVDGVPQFVDRPDAVFSGILEKERVERMLRGQLGKDAIIVVTNVDSGQHRYEMDLETFVLNARITDEETGASPDDDDDDGDADTAGPAPDSEPTPASQEDSAGATPEPKDEDEEDDDGVDGVDDPF